ncbi:unnamed protein product [Prorocentrum cordatum]|uniref:Uncharacterized protein n=1 Tax=Prorocentrum cordatum TaxID=2364126 RepID=A0ABN9TAA1_9DINO|nr:unnamed protein product [Polarella glacialis]
MGEYVLSACSDDQGIFATDLHTGALVATFEESVAQPCAFGMVGGSSGHVHAVQANKALWHVWAWGDKKPSYRASLPEKMTAMTFTGDATLCFGGAASGSIYVWQAATGALLSCWPAHYREVTQLVVSQDESLLVSASADASVNVYAVADVCAERAPRPLHSWSGHALPVTSVALLPGGGLHQVVVSASLDRSVRLWDVGTGKPLASHTLPVPVHSVSVSPSGAELLVAGGCGELRSISPPCGPGEGASSYVGHAGTVLSCALNADGSKAVSCSEADRVRVWETRMRQCISQVHASRGVKIGSVQVVRCAGFAHSLPPFQPFQRLLQAPESSPATPIPTSGREAALRQAMRECSGSGDFVDRLAWAQADGEEAAGGVEQLRRQLAEAQAGQARWAAAAAGLYGALVDAGLDGRLA